MSSTAETAALRTSCLCWGNEGVALGTGLDLTVHPGEVVAIVGPNGAGKTTLLRTLAGQISALAGSVQLSGAPLDELSPRASAQRVALLPQQPNIDVDLSVGELVELGRTPYLGLWGSLGERDRQAVREALVACDLLSHASRPLRRLSGGERQRAQLALAIAQQTPLVLLDEPTTHLDLKWRHELFLLLARLRRQRSLAMVITLHQLGDAYRECDRVLVVSGGCAEEVTATDPQRCTRLAHAFGVPPDRIDL